MGFRSTIITEDLGGIKLPKWFVQKWSEYYNFGSQSHAKRYYKDNTLLISSKFENKFYMGEDEEIFIDIQKICQKKDIDKFIIVMLHECGGITRVQIEKDKIRWTCGKGGE